MAIMQGITGKLSGKMGSAVFRVRKGAQVVAQYNPNVANPKSKDQNNQRAKFKLASQLAAEIGNSMAFTTTARAGHGSTTQRNEFIKANLPEITIVENGSEAKIALAAIKLTNSNRAFNADISVVAETNNISVGYIINDPSIEQVVAVQMSLRQVEVVDGYGTMSVLSLPERRASQVVNVVNGRAQINFEFTANDRPADFAILTYGIIKTSSTEVTITNSTAGVTDDTVFASSIIQKNLRQNNIQVTMTQGFQVA